MNKNNDNLNNLRHTTAHLLAAAVLRLYPGTKPTIGPTIENGFYYDFDLLNPISEENLSKIEQEMKTLLKEWNKVEQKEISPKEAKKMFKDNPYKLELIEELRKTKEPITVVRTGDFEDLCRGGHIENPSKEIKAFKLLSIAGAYWRGDEKNKMLTRIYGTSFPTQEELDQYLQMLEETKKRDHRKIGKEQDLFSFHEEAPGFVFWHPKGMLLRAAIMKVYNELQDPSNYQTVSTPILLSEELWHKSGHWDNYKDKMYFTKVDNKTFAIKPMNCPGVSLIYKERIRSYRDLPLRFAEHGEVHRHEPSGTLHGLFRVRAFRQDDAHLFVREDQIEEEVKNIIKLTLGLYKVIGFKEVNIELSTRPEKSIGSNAIWEKAESIMKKVLEDLELKFNINEGDGAFYGPKIDFHIKDSIGRSWQCGTVQLDFFMPERFELEYIDKDGLPKRPIMIHRTLIGSIQRFTGILIEHFAGAFPTWLSPIQVQIVPITDRNLKYAQNVLEQLLSANIRTELDDRSETMQAKIRDAQLQKIPYMLILGDREEKEGKVTVRTRESKDTGAVKIEEFINHIKKAIDSKAGL